MTGVFTFMAGLGRNKAGTLCRVSSLYTVDSKMGKLCCFLLLQRLTFSRQLHQSDGDLGLLGRHQVSRWDMKVFTAQG